MNTDFAWLKWVGFFVVVSILGAVLYLFLNDKSKTFSTDQEVQKIQSQKEFNEEIDQIVLAAHESEIETKEREDNPPVYEARSLEQTKEFIHRVEKIHADDLKINLKSTPDVARQSRKYNRLEEEAEHIYGMVDISNPYRYCTAMVIYVRELWTLTYRPSTLSEEYIENSKTRYLESYHDAKKACLDDVV